MKRIFMALIMAVSAIALFAENEHGTIGILARTGTSDNSLGAVINLGRSFTIRPFAGINATLMPPLEDGYNTVSDTYYYLGGDILYQIKLTDDLYLGLGPRIYCYLVDYSTTYPDGTTSSTNYQWYYIYALASLQYYVQPRVLFFLDVGMCFESDAYNSTNTSGNTTTYWYDYINTATFNVGVSFFLK
jgi:hypothetical protein